MSDVSDPNLISKLPETDSANSGGGQKNHSQPRAKSNRLLIGIIVVLVAVTGILLYALLRPVPQEAPTDGRATFITPENVDDVKNQMSKPITDAYYTTSMSVDWYFDNGQAVSTTAYVENAPENTRTVYFDVNLENGDLVYSSPYLPVGEKMEQITLDKDLDAGDYPAVCTYFLVDDDHKVITHVSVAVTLHILN